LRAADASQRRADGQTVDHIQERSDREPAADLEPWVDLLPGPAVHPDLSPLAAFTAPNEHSASAAVEIALLQSERFADPEARAPQRDNQRAKPVTVGTVGRARARAACDAGGVRLSRSVS
jgi:hypothetical protein